MEHTNSAMHQLYGVRRDHCFGCALYPACDPENRVVWDPFLDPFFLTNRRFSA